MLTLGGKEGAEFNLRTKDGELIARVVLVRVEGRRARVGFQADESILVYRKQIDPFVKPVGVASETR